ncbi:MAG: SHOCT domain-containing protein [Haloarculaceae archaeon]
MSTRSRRPDLPGPLVGAVAGGVTVLVLAVAFALHALDVSWAWVVYPLGFGGLLPLALGAAGRYERGERSGRRRSGRRRDRGRPGVETTTDDGEATALRTLRRRYARGEIDEAEFERRVELLLRTESITEAAASLDARPPAERTAPERQ